MQLGKFLTLKSEEGNRLRPRRLEFSPQDQDNAGGRLERRKKRVIQILQTGCIPILEVLDVDISH